MWLIGSHTDILNNSEIMHFFQGDVLSHEKKEIEVCVPKRKTLLVEANRTCYNT